MKLCIEAGKLFDTLIQLTLNTHSVSVVNGRKTHKTKIMKSSSLGNPFFVFQKAVHYCAVYSMKLYGDFRW